MLRQLLYELLRGAAYRRIQHPEMRSYTVWLPTALTIITVLIYAALPVKPVLIGKDGAISSALTLISTLPGFYFAGLAAVATFGNQDMDREMPAPAPTINIRVAGRVVTSKLTRRLFLTYLFAYLVIVSFVVCIMFIGLNAISGSIDYWQSTVEAFRYGRYFWTAIKAVVGGGITFLMASLVVTSLHGIFFLTEKMHQP